MVTIDPCRAIIENNFDLVSGEIDRANAAKGNEKP